MNVFGSMITELSAEAYKDNDFTPISKDEYAIFCKEYIFEKLKNIKFGTAFQKRFEVRDRVLSMFSEQKDAMEHIERYYIGEINE
jgi:hypothetical protein